MPTPSRARKPLILVALAIFTLVGGAAVGLRARRSTFTPPAELQPGLWSSKMGGGILVLAARVGKHAVLFDAGVDPSGKGIDALLAAMQLGRADVSQIFLTHGHADHTAAAAAFPAARLYTGAADVELIAGRASPEALMPRFFSLIWSNPPARVTDPLSGVTTIPLGDAADATPSPGSAAGAPANSSGKTVRAYPVPGHTPGSYAYLFDGALITGDILMLTQGKLTAPPGIFDPHPADNLRSVRELGAAVATEKVDRICTAHGGCTLSGQGRPLLDAFLASAAAGQK